MKANTQTPNAKDLPQRANVFKFLQNTNELKVIHCKCLNAQDLVLILNTDDKTAVFRQFIDLSSFKIQHQWHVTLDQFKLWIEEAIERMPVDMVMVLSHSWKSQYGFTKSDVIELKKLLCDIWNS